MSDAIQQAITAMEWMLCDYEHLNTMGQPLSANWPQRVQAVKDAIAGLQAAQAQAGDGESPVGWLVMVDGYYKFFAIYDDALDARKHEEYWNKGLAQEEPKPVYTRPQPQVNQQLLEALDKLVSVAEMCDSWESFPSKALDEARAAIAAAQEGGGNE